MWGHVAAHVAEVISNLSKRYDERQFNENLARLEKLVDDIGKFQAQSVREESKAQDAKPADKSSTINNP
jgi:hypothetical protein